MSDSSSSPELFKKKKDCSFLNKKRSENNRRHYQNKKSKLTHNDSAAKSFRISLPLNEPNTSENLDNSIENLLNVQVDSLSKSEPYQSSNDSSSTESDAESTESCSEGEEVETTKYLYVGFKVLVKDFLISINLIKFKHSLSNKAINHFMELIKEVLPQPNECPRSLKTSRKYFLPSDKKSFSKSFTICINCENMVEERRINNFKCFKCITDQSVIPFLTFDIKKQLELILSNQTNIGQIHKSVKTAKSSNVLNSTPIGSLYYRKKVKDIENDTIVSLNINSDGAPITKYKSFSIWPVFGTIVELNDSSRERFENVILFGVWISRRKPLYNKFFATVFEELSGLINKNVNINGKLFF